MILRIKPGTGERTPIPDKEGENHEKQNTDGVGSFLCLSLWAPAQTWESARRMTYSTRDSVDSDIAANGTKVYVLWAEDDPVSGYRDLFYRLSTNAGATWSTAKN